MFKTLDRLLCGVTSYAVFLATYLYAIGFVTNLFVPRSIDSAPSGNLVSSIVVDVALLLGVRHSAQRHGAAGFQAVADGFHPDRGAQHVCLASSLALIALFAFWQPLAPSRGGR